MDFPRGHAALPLTESDFLDFIYNYFKAEYYPIRSFWSTATALPHQPDRWISMGHELAPLMVRPANAQAQKDLESLDYFTRKWNLDAGFVRGLVIRFAKYELHERLEKKLYECARLDLMVCKALKEKHLIDALWPSPAPRTIAKELLQQGVQVRQWYGDMFNKYFRVLHSLDDFKVREEIDRHIKSSGTLMLLPFVDHLVFGNVDPIIPIVAKGAGYSNAKNWQRQDQSAAGFGEPGKFEIRFDSPSEVTDTYTKTVRRQCQCMKCGTKRDVQVVVSIDPSPGPVASGDASSRNKRRDTAPSHSRSRHRYSPGYQMPTESEPAAPPQPPRPQQAGQNPEPTRPSTPEFKKQCPRCTFLNDPSLHACEMCEASLPETTITQPPSPAAIRRVPSHSHSVSAPPPTAPNPRQEELKKEQRPNAPNRHSLSSSLFSIFPFSQQHQQEHHAKLPATQSIDTQPAVQSSSRQEPRPSSKHGKDPQPEMSSIPKPELPQRHQPRASTPPPNRDSPTEPHLSQPPEMAMMPLTPSPPTSSSKRPVPAGLPSNLMDDFVPVSPGFGKDDDEDEDAGWGSMSREEARQGHESNSDEEEGGVGKESGKGVFIDLDAVAREEADVWGDRDD
ncbi:hypothetical protein COCMIDRAFT_33886 [Bipolaris oryzae ATCC 44560]|uniref:RanBP2-type domain-containing protein n=1 Tax=Bipolaris oryzae ATCC 44560 TaxID=930090 RepID=W6ZXK2_COCMI|nr:uncharacterized protein COCMIDRAFT_33886 [Bipolaris oryzae ATCC 44560]EUC48606.1 hypothetical protein COCMIDRAFT_33886 [Bipolaris oryzae ATCC 44560]